MPERPDTAYWGSVPGGADAKAPDAHMRNRTTDSVYLGPRKDHVSAGLLAIALGMFGVHKFYLGYNQPAFAMLAVSIIGGILTFGLAAIIIWAVAIVEGFIYLARSQTAFEREYVLARREWF